MHTAQTPADWTGDEISFNIHLLVCIIEKVRLEGEISPYPLIYKVIPPITMYLKLRLKDQLSPRRIHITYILTYITNMYVSYELEKGKKIKDSS